MKKIIVWMLTMAMMLASLTGCVDKQEVPAEPVSNTQETELEVTEIQEEETQSHLVEGFELPDDEFDDIDETETEREESTEPASSETNQGNKETTQPAETPDQNNGGYESPEDVF